MVLIDQNVTKLIKPKQFLNLFNLINTKIPLIDLNSDLPSNRWLDIFDDSI